MLSEGDKGKDYSLEEFKQLIATTRKVARRSSRETDDRLENLKQK